MQTGLQIAFLEGYDFAMQVDGDGQHPPQEISKLLRRCANRPPTWWWGRAFWVSDGFKSTAVRRIGFVFSDAAFGGLPYAITDPTSGFRLMNRRAIRLLPSVTPKIFLKWKRWWWRIARDCRSRKCSVQMSERKSREVEHRHGEIVSLHDEGTAGHLYEPAAQARDEFLISCCFISRAIFQSALRG